MTIRIERASAGMESAVAELARRMWKAHTQEELEEEFRGLLESGNAAVYLAYDGGRPAGFAQCQLRTDYVEGTAASPVGYLEGIYVEEIYRGSGVASRLLGACEAWARGLGCREFASDCELGNEASLAFHMRMGFREANRIICFTKRL